MPQKNHLPLTLLHFPSMAPFFLLCFTLSFTITHSSPTLLFPLKTQNLPPNSHLSSSYRLPFRHNVTLAVTLTAGTPPQNISMVLDTGSELSYLHCKKTHLFPSSFSPSLSSSYSPVPCSSPTCRLRTLDLTTPVSCDPHNLCHTSLCYSDSTSLEGTLSTDTFHLSPSSSKPTVFGCIHSSTTPNPSEDRKTTGLLGLNRGALSFISQSTFSKFSYCISPHASSGVLLFGENTTFPWLRPLNYTPIVHNLRHPRSPYFNNVAYTLNFTGIKVSGREVRLERSLLEPDHTGAGQTMVDSGTQFTFLLGPVYAALKEEFKRKMGRVLLPLEEPGFVFQGAMDLCYLVPKRMISLPRLPTVSLVFRGAEMRVVGERLLYKVPGEERGSNFVYCFTFGNSELLGMEAYVVGHHHQQNMWMEFDLKRSRVGFARFPCEVAGRRLGLNQ